MLAIAERMGLISKTNQSLLDLKNFAQMPEHLFDLEFYRLLAAPQGVL